MERVLILLSNPENRSLLAQMLMPHYDVALAFPTDPPGTERARDIDLCILDGSSLKKYGSRLLAERLAIDPVLLPVLLLSDRRSIGSMTRELWHAVDDIVLRPLEKLEMRARVDSLARARRLSLQLRSVSNAYRAERKVAQRFQRAALPRQLPRVPGLTFSSFYRPGMDEAQVGGDWYDALLLADGRVMVSIGDVCGSGLDAAVAMASVRQVVRGVAQIHADPAMLLDAADRTLQAENPDSLVTAFVGVFDPITSLLSYASAGHPRPLVRDADGTLRDLASTGAPLGLPFPLDRSVHATELPTGSMLVLYTDGLTEATRDPIAGEASLRRALRDDDVLAAPNVALAIHDAVISDGARDDVAVMTVQRVERDLTHERLMHWSFDSSDADVAREVRREFLSELQRTGVPQEGLARAELVFSELLGNVVRYASRWVDVTLDSSGTAPVLHVLDGGPGFQHVPRLPESPLSESGRGLYIVDRLTQEFHVNQRPHGGSHARAVLAR
ncbi:MAG: hypothetical protein NVSMB19_18990 [Vulcanimicrobiaceae bacterium]